MCAKSAFLAKIAPFFTSAGLCGSRDGRRLAWMRAAEWPKGDLSSRRVVEGRLIADRGMGDGRLEIWQKKGRRPSWAWPAGWLKAGLRGPWVGQRWARMRATEWSKAGSGVAQVVFWDGRRLACSRAASGAGSLALVVGGAEVPRRATVAAWVARGRFLLEFEAAWRKVVRYVLPPHAQDLHRPIRIEWARGPARRHFPRRR